MKDTMQPHPADWNGDPYTISDNDMTMPDFPVPFFLVYKLPSGVNLQHLADSMQQGLDKAAERLPSLAAKICLDDAKRPLRRLSPGAPLKLAVRTFEPGEYKSYVELAQRSFSPTDFEFYYLLPEGTFTPPDAMYERQVFVVQLNFIPGGIILAVALNHIAGDGSSQSLAITLVCDCAKACLEGKPDPDMPHTYSFDRRPFSAHEEITAQSK